MRITEFLSQRAVNVGSTPIPVNQSSEAGYVIIYNDGAGKIFIGGSTVNTDTGLPLEPQNGIVFEVSPTAKIYILSDSNAVVRILEVR